MLNLSLTARIALARAQANPGMPVTSVPSVASTTTTTSTTDAPVTNTDAAPTIPSEEVDFFYDASPEDFSRIEVGRSDPPPSNNNTNNDDDAFYNANDEFVGPSWWYDEEEGNNDNDDGNDEGYFWSDDDGAAEPDASLFADENLCAPAASVEVDENARPIAPLRRRRTARTSSGSSSAGNVSAPAQKEEHVNVTGDLRASVVVVNHVASEPTSGSVSVPVVCPPIEVKPVSAGVSEPTVAPPTAIIDEDTFIPLAPRIIVADLGIVTVAAGAPIAIPGVAVDTTAVTDMFPEDPMDIDGPEFSDHHVHWDPMDVDLFPPCIARQVARLLGLSGPSGVVRGRSLPVVRSSRVNTRKSVAVGVRSVRLGVRVGGGVRAVPVRTTIRRRFRLVSDRT